MRTERYVHFVYLGGDWVWQHWRAVETAKVHDGHRLLWTAGRPSDVAVELAQFGSIEGVAFKGLELPDWLRDHPIRLANVKDAFMWRILFEHGGLYLDMDTISLAPVWDLLTRDVLVSQEWPSLSDGEHPYNSAVVAGRKGARVLGELEQSARRILEAGESRWGKTGPHLLTDVVASFPDEFDIAGFGVLSGWRFDTIRGYYEGDPIPEGTRVIHTYSSSFMPEFSADRWMPGQPRLRLDSDALG